VPQAVPRNVEAIDWDKRALNVTWVDPVTGEQWTYAVEAGVVSCSVDLPSSGPPPGTFGFIVADLAAAAAFIGALTRVSWRLLRALPRRRTEEGS
jgi:hypothetical protein